MNNRVILSLGLLCLLSLHAHAEPQTILQSGADYVRLEPAEHGAPANAHPAAFSTEQLTALFSQLRVNSGGLLRSQPTELFTPAALERLARAVAMGLSQAQPDEEITFALSELRAGMIGRDSMVTSGRIFVRDGELNLILGEMVQPLRTLVSRRAQASDGVLQPRAGYLSKAVADRISVEPGTRQRARSGNALAANAAFRFPEGARKDWTAAALTPAALAPATVAAESTPASVPPGTDTLESRLKRLKALHAEGLITEEIFQEKQRELLREF